MCDLITNGSFSMTDFLEILGRKMKSKTIVCPKCGRRQTYTDECINCGVIISKYFKLQKLRESGLGKTPGRYIDLVAKKEATKGKKSRIGSRSKRWDLAFSIGFILFIGFSWLVFRAFSPGEMTIGQHVESVDWLPASATDISYEKRDGFGWIKNYDCLISEDDFLILAEEEGWLVQEDETFYFYENRHPNGGGVTVHYDKISKRLSVQSNHR